MAISADSATPVDCSHMSTSAYSATYWISTVKAAQADTAPLMLQLHAFGPSSQKIASSPTSARSDQRIATPTSIRVSTAVRGKKRKNLAEPL